LSRLLVTGSTGFIGSLFSNYFSDAGFTVFGCSKKPPTDTSVPYEWFSCDLTIPLSSFPEVDYCIHAAGLSPHQSNKAEDFDRVNCQGTSELIKILGKTKCQGLIFLSGMSVYGKVSTSFVDERTACTSPSSYGLSKLKAEKLLSEQNLFPSIHLRLPGVLGPGSSTPWLTRQINHFLQGETVHVHSPDDLFNNAVWVEDIAKLIENLLINKNLQNNKFVLGAEGKESIIDLMNYIKTKTKSKSTIKVEDGSNPFMINYSKARNLGYNPLHILKMVEKQISIEKQCTANNCIKI
jgi:nucleoside-diphosphate-sugar epimerase